jgi:hypothetical protein
VKGGVYNNFRRLTFHSHNQICSSFVILFRAFLGVFLLSPHYHIDIVIFEYTHSSWHSRADTSSREMYLKFSSAALRGRYFIYRCFHSFKVLDDSLTLRFSVSLCARNLNTLIQSPRLVSSNILENRSQRRQHSTSKAIEAREALKKQFPGSKTAISTDPKSPNNTAEHVLLVHSLTRRIRPP